MKNWPISGDDGLQVNVTAASAAVLVTDDARETVSDDVMIDNPGPNDVFVKAGGPEVAASTLSVRVPAASLQPYRKGNHSHLALVCRGGQSQTVVVHVGDGV